MWFILRLDPSVSELAEGESQDVQGEAFELRAQLVEFFEVSLRLDGRLTGQARGMQDVGRNFDGEDALGILAKGELER